MNGLGDTMREAVSWTSGESRSNIYTLLYVKWDSCENLLYDTGSPVCSSEMT